MEERSPPREPPADPARFPLDAVCAWCGRRPTLVAWSTAHQRYVHIAQRGRERSRTSVICGGEVVPAARIPAARLAPGDVTVCFPTRTSLIPHLVRLCARTSRRDGAWEGDTVCGRTFRQDMLWIPATDAQRDALELCKGCREKEEMGLARRGIGEGAGRRGP